MARQASNEVRHHIALRCVGPTGAGAVLPVALTYGARDPYAVSLAFGAMSGDIVWTFGRDLLRDGVGGPVGIGDVRIWPERDAFGRSMLMIEFRSPDGELVVNTPIEPVHEFLACTYDLVAAGAESESLDVDSIIDQLLAA